MQKKKDSAINGWVLLDKPEGISSARALAKVKSALNCAKAGHAGTLDPAASGLLLIALGEACKFLPLLDLNTKSYDFDLCWGYSTDTDDNEGKPLEHSPLLPNKSAITQTCVEFLGFYDQMPPAYSALKVNGIRAYQLARLGQAPKLSPRQVNVHLLNINDHQMYGEEQDIIATTKLSTTLGKGGYVRALGRDIADKMNAQAHVRHIRRTRIGKLSIENAIPLAIIDEKRDKIDKTRQGWVLCLASVLDDIPALDVHLIQMQRLRHGQRIPLSEWSDQIVAELPLAENPQSGSILLRYQQQLFGIAHRQGRCIKPYRLVHQSDIVE